MLALVWLGTGALELRRYRRQMAAFTERDQQDELDELDAEKQVDDTSHSLVR